MTYNKELITFRKENQTVYTVTSNKNAKCYVDDEEIQDEDRITTYFTNQIQHLQNFLMVKKY